MTAHALAFYINLFFIFIKVYDQEQLDLLISKEIIHFSIQNEVINETVLGLEVIN